MEIMEYIKLYFIIKKLVIINKKIKKNIKKKI